MKRKHSNNEGITFKSREIIRVLYEAIKAKYKSWGKGEQQKWYKKDRETKRKYFI